LFRPGGVISPRKPGALLDKVWERSLSPLSRIKAESESAVGKDIKKSLTYIIASDKTFTGRLILLNG